MFETSTRRWTVRDLMKVSMDFMRRNGVDEARLTTELLLAHALQWPRLKLYTDHDLPLSDEELERFRRLVRRRLANEPVQYITQEAHFMGLKFHVDDRVLIPRPETETLVEQVILWCKDHPKESEIRILDVGSGSGNIAIACAKFISRCRVTAVDLHPGSINVARSNAENHGVADRISIAEWDMMQEVPQMLHRAFDVVVSNPPYVPLADWEQLEPLVRDSEPQRGLTDGGDGYRFHRRLASIAFDLLDSTGPLMLEVGDDQAVEVSRILKQSGAVDVGIVDDLSRVQRVVAGTFSIGRLQ